MWDAQFIVCLERDVVVWGGRGRGTLTVSTAVLAASATALGTSGVSAGLAATSAARVVAAAPLASAQETDLVGDDLGGPAVVSVPVLPFFGAKSSLDEHLATLAQELRHILGGAAETSDPMPLGVVIPVAIAVLDALCGRNSKLAHDGAGAGCSCLGVGAEIADEDDFVDGHGFVLQSGQPL
jgi:hypothetical protein